MNAPWWDGIPAAVTTVECSGRPHRLRWRDGQLSTADHGDVAGERTLAALAGQRYHCIDLFDAWQRHRADLDVLVLASRGPADALCRPPDADMTRSIGFFAAKPLARRVARASSSASTAMPILYSDPPAERTAAIAPEAELPTLLTLGGGLPDRLVATVVAESIRLLPEEPGDVDARLYAALYGRAVAAVRGWLGRPDSPVEVNIVGATTPPSLSRDGDRTTLRLPFSWLGDVWTRGLATIMGRFVLSATATGDGRWSLLAVGPDDEQPKTLTIQPT